MFTARIPPSTRSVVPVIHDASDEARKATADAMSSGGADPAERVEGRRPGQLRVAARPGVGSDRAGGDQVDPDAARARVARQRTGQAGQARLRGAVRVAAEVLFAVDRADGDDRAPARGDQMRQGGAGAAERAGQGDVQVAFPLLVRLVLEELGVLARRVRVVDQDVEPAEGLDGVRHRRVHRRTVGHVAGQGRGGAARLAYRRRRVGRALRVQVRDEDRGPFRRQAVGRCRADALAGGGDQDAVAGEAGRCHRCHGADRTALTKAWARGSAVTPFWRPLVT